LLLETRFAQSEFTVYKSFEKNYKTCYRTTWSGEAISVVPELDPVARAYVVVVAAAA